MNLTEQLAAFPLLHAETPAGRISYRRAAPTPAPASPALVLLHGIGSASASWLHQLQQLGREQLVLAWNAPGYGGSSDLPMAAPAARDYASRMWAWLDVLGVGQVNLVGHSLGALMAAAATRAAPQRVARLVLLAPASGYGAASAGLRDAKLRDRLSLLDTLGPQGIADQRGAAMLSATASADQVAYIKGVMAQIEPHGYAQAARMLAGGDLAADVATITCPISVASGSADVITPPAGCQAAARAARTGWIDLGAVGHACPLEAADAVKRLLATAGIP